MQRDISEERREISEMKRYWTSSWLWRFFRIQISIGKSRPRQIILGHWGKVCLSGSRQDFDIRVWKRCVIGGRKRQYSFIDRARPWMWGITLCKWREPTKSNDWSEWEDVWGRGRLGFKGRSPV